MLTLKSKIQNAIDYLLANSTPSKQMKFRLFKLLTRYYPYTSSYAKFEMHCELFYSKPIFLRDQKLMKIIFGVDVTTKDANYFILKSYDAVFDSNSLAKASCAMEWIFKNEFGVSKEISTPGVFLSVINRFSSTYSGTKVELTPIDFLYKWERFCFKNYGNKYEKMFKNLEQIIESDDDRSNWSLDSFISGQQNSKIVQLTQTQLDWINNIKANLDHEVELPPYPLSNQIELPQLVNINKHVILYNRLKKRSSEDHWINVETVADSLQQLCRSALGESDLMAS